MPRPLRVVQPGVPMHIVQRGNNRRRTFHQSRDYLQFCDALRDASVSHACRLHAYVLMSNHFHLLVTPSDETGPAEMMQQLGRTFGVWLNIYHHRTGNLWEGRYRSSLIDTEQYFFTCSRYIELNPVRAMLVSAPGDYRWSSYHANALGSPDALVNPHPLYDALGQHPDARAAAYRDMFAQPIPIDVLDGLRRAVRAGASRPSAGNGTRASTERGERV